MSPINAFCLVSLNMPQFRAPNAPITQNALRPFPFNTTQRNKSPISSKRTCLHGSPPVFATWVDAFVWVKEILWHLLRCYRDWTEAGSVLRPNSSGVGGCGVTARRQPFHECAQSLEYYMHCIVPAHVTRSVRGDASSHNLARPDTLLVPDDEARRSCGDVWFSIESNQPVMDETTSSYFFV